jgi:hypothetical protein
MSMATMLEWLAQKVSDFEICSESLQDEYSEFIRCIAATDENNESYNIETYVSLDGWDVPYYVPRGYSFHQCNGYTCLYKDHKYIRRFDKNEETSRRMIGADVERERELGRE